MNALVFIILALGAYVFSYLFYARFLSEKIWKLDSKKETPAIKYDDGYEYVPTRTDVVAGHHFTSIAGAAPIVGPVVAAIWGWLPGLLWIIIGTVFFGAVHDLGVLVTSLRHEGRGIADFLQDLLGKRATQLMYLLIFFLLVLVSAVFIHVIAVLAEAYPAAIYSIWIEIPLAIIMGFMIRYKWKVNIYVVSAIAVAIMYGVIVLGFRYPLALDYKTWVVILLIYMFIAARLPVWLLVQPRDFINGMQLVIALGACTMGIIILVASGGGVVAAPAVRLFPEGAPPIWPFVMITIACGAISGWHSIVGSGTTPKQLRKETDAKAVGYGSMLAEGYLSLIALLTAVVGLGVVGYQEFYASWGQASWPVVWAQGGGTFITALGIPATLAAVFMAVVAKSFAMTTLDSAMRFTRIAFAEGVKTFHLPPYLSGKTLSIIPGWIAIAVLAYSGHGMKLWPLFGASNQILASLALLTAAVFLLTLGRSTANYIIPFVIMIITSMIAMGHSIFLNYIPNQEWMLVIIGSIIFLCGLGVVIIAIGTWRSKKGQTYSKGHSIT